MFEEVCQRLAFLGTGSTHRFAPGASRRSATVESLAPRHAVRPASGASQGHLPRSGWERETGQTITFHSPGLSALFPSCPSKTKGCHHPCPWLTMPRQPSKVAWITPVATLETAPSPCKHWLVNVATLAPVDTANPSPGGRGTRPTASPNRPRLPPLLGVRGEWGAQVHGDGQWGLV